MTPTELLDIRLAKHLSDQMRRLLEDRHLYQRVDFNPQGELGECLRGNLAKRDGSPDCKAAISFAHRAWEPYPEDASAGAIHSHVSRTLPPVAFRFPLSTAKLFCVACGRREPFAPRGFDHGWGIKTVASVGDLRELGKPHQHLTLLYQCQSCAKLPDAFLLQRTGSKVQLCGRAPMEHVETPPDVPEPVRDYFREAVLAEQCGRALAGLFFLRTTIEQWVRVATKAGPTVRADQALDMYMDQLPGDFKARFPSLRSLYENLSDAVHSARADDALLGSAMRDLLRHFEARRIFELK